MSSAREESNQSSSASLPSASSTGTPDVEGILLGASPTTTTIPVPESSSHSAHRDNDALVHALMSHPDEHPDEGGDDDDSEDHSHRSRLREEMLGIRRYLFEKLHLTSFGRDESDARHLPKVLDTVDFAGVMKHWSEGKFKKIITMVGAGISTSAGIPDFRSPKTGLYHNLQKYDLPHPSAIFELDYFNENPKPFFTLAKELYPGAFKPTPSHYFIKLLENHGMLHRHYTQNIDTLEHIARISPDKIIEAHGSFYTNHCLVCRQQYTKEWMKAEIFANRIPRCNIPECTGVVKPDIVFFGESLPAKFHDSIDEDFDDCDLLIIMGTSLEVQPFAALPDRVNDSCVRLLINREIVGNKGIWGILAGLGIGGSMEFGQPNSRRDVAWLGDCDDGAMAMARALGLEEELKHLIEVGHAEIDVEMTEVVNNCEAATAIGSVETGTETPMAVEERTQVTTGISGAIIGEGSADGGGGGNGIL